MSIFRFTPKIPTRLLLDCVSLLMLIICLAYYWLGNLTHEWLGLALIAFMIIHNFFNQLWYRHINKHVKKTRPRFILMLNIILLAVVLTLVTTSLFVSRELVPNISERPSNVIRRLHFASGYWMFIIVAIHVGFNSNKVLNWLHNYSWSRNETFQTFLRLSICSIGIIGLFSIDEMVFIDKLLMNPVLFMWDFSNPYGFIFHHLAIFIAVSLISYLVLHRIRWFKHVMNHTSR